MKISAVEKEQCLTQAFYRALTPPESSDKRATKEAKDHSCKIAELNCYHISESAVLSIARRRPSHKSQRLNSTNHHTKSMGCKECPWNPAIWIGARLQRTQSGEYKGGQNEEWTKITPQVSPNISHYSLKRLGAGVTKNIHSKCADNFFKPVFCRQIQLSWCCDTSHMTFNKILSLDSYSMSTSNPMKVVFRIIEDCWK